MKQNHGNERLQMFFPDRLDVRAPITDLLSRRWSPRAFSDRRIEPSKVLSLFEAARWSPSSSNDQPWRFLAATEDDHNTYSSLLSVLSENNRRWAQRAPLLVLAVARSQYSRSGKPHRHSWYDLGQSIAHMTVQAESLGLAVHQIGGFDAGRARESFSIPPDYDPVVVIAVGYVDSPESLPEDLRHREQAPRSRQPLETLVYTESWGLPSRHVEVHSSPLSQSLSSN